MMLTRPLEDVRVESYDPEKHRHAICTKRVYGVNYTEHIRLLYTTSHILKAVRSDYSGDLQIAVHGLRMACRLTPDIVAHLLNGGGDALL